MMEPTKTIARTYRVSWKEIREKLGLVGEFKGLQLLTGRSPNQIEKGVSADVDMFEISTEEEIKPKGQAR